MAGYENIKLEKSFYSTSGGFSRALENADPSENYKGTSLEGLDAFERQLKRFDIRVGSNGSDMIEKFFKTSESATLFPEYISRAVRQGMESNDIISKIVATTTKIDGLDYRAITSNISSKDTELKRVAEGAFIPHTYITPQNNLVSLNKRGRMIISSYETLRFQRIDLFTVMLKQVGAQIANQQLEDAVKIIVDTTFEISGENSSNLTYNDLLKLWNEMGDFDLTTLIVSGKSMQQILAMDEFRDAAAGQNFHATGKLITPFGAEIIKSKTIPENNIIGLDKKCAIEKVEAGGIVTDYDKLIDRQLERAAITCTTGFSKIFDGASKILIKDA